MSDTKTELAHEHIADIQRYVAIVTSYINTRSVGDWSHADWGTVGDLGRLADGLRDITEWVALALDADQRQADRLG